MPLDTPPALQSQIAPTLQWSDTPQHSHLVQFYEDDAFLIEAVCNFVCTALAQGHAAIIIATGSHRDAVEERMHSRGQDIQAARETGQYVALDAAETLSKFMVDGKPDERAFVAIVGGLISRVAKRFPRVQAFGEMVALLWAEDNSEAAIALEKQWNNLARVQDFSLCCAYPINGFARHVHGKPFLDVCAEHSHVVPGESYLGLTTQDERMRTVAELQQKMAALQTEIEEHRKTEAALKRREEELSDFLEHAAQGLHQVGADGVIMWANRAEMDLLGYSSGEYIGHHIAEFHADPAVIDDILSKLTGGDRLSDYPARLRCRDGSIKHVLITSNARIENGRFMNTRCFTRDVTDRVRLEEAARARMEELADADRRKDEFLAMLSHELRNPLAPIFTALEILDLPRAEPSAGRTARDVIRRQVRHMTCIVDDLLEVSRITSGKIQLRQQRVELSSVIDHAVETTRSLVEAKRHWLSVSLPSVPVLLTGDPTRLEQVFTNLLTNAAKYSESGSEISVSAHAKNGDAVITVKDTGLGMSTDLLPRLFSLFTQADRSLDRARGGLGIGLWMVRKLVELHGGSVSAHSDGIGKGSTFTVTLPRSASDAVETGSSAVRVAAAPRRSRILVVDDNRDAADMLAIRLRMSGHDVQVAHDGLTAIQMATAHHPSVVLLDIGLPGIDGYGVAVELRKLDAARAMCLIALTGYGRDEDRERCRASGFDHHFVKPVEPARLDEVLARLAGSAEPPRPA
jgi:PAS domain S-box-containing protein